MIHDHSDKRTRIVQLEAWHLERLRAEAQCEQRDEARVQGGDMPGGSSWAALQDGRPVAAAGVVEVWPGRGYVWALFPGRWPVRAVMREIRARLDGLRFARLEMAVDAEFEAAARFAEHLGFSRESTARRYMPNGHDAHIYVRFAECLS